MEIIKVIDLYNKIVNDEEVPKKIKLKGFKYIFTLREDCTGDKWYGEESTHEDFGETIIRNLEYVLNCEVEIIEEEIEKLNYKVEQLDKPSHNESLLMNMIRENKETINKLIDELKKEK